MKNTHKQLFSGTTTKVNFASKMDIYLFHEMLYKNTYIILLYLIRKLHCGLNLVNNI